MSSKFIFYLIENRQRNYITLFGNLCDFIFLYFEIKNSLFDSVEMDATLMAKCSLGKGRGGFSPGGFLIFFPI
jgi:hypothetical protein